MSGDPLPREGRRRGWLASVERGQLLGTLARPIAERAFRLYRERRVSEVSWSGDSVEGLLETPEGQVTVSVADGVDGTEPEPTCSVCGDELCPHATAVLFRWIEIRPTMRRKGPGTVWRGWSRQPFLTAAPQDRHLVELPQADPDELLGAIRFQLSLNRSGSATAVLDGDRVTIETTLPSGATRNAAFDTRMLPPILPSLKTLTGLKLDAELAELELSEIRLRPALRSAWTAEGIHLVPGFELLDGDFLELDRVDRDRFGRWVRLGRHLCRVYDPPLELARYFDVGRQVIRGREGLRFLPLDHPSLRQLSGYRPGGLLATFTRPRSPSLASATLEEADDDRVWLKPTWEVEGEELSWDEALRLKDLGFVRKGEHIVSAPDLGPLEAAGFRRPERGAKRGLIGSRLAAIRLAAEGSVRLETGSGDLRRLLDALVSPLPEDPEPPEGLVSSLRPYQRTGVAWLWRLCGVGLGALLADDMGLGKTHQAMGLMCHVHAGDPDACTLVVCPRGVLEHWHRLMRLYAPHLPVHVFHGPDRNVNLADSGPGVILTTYETAVRSRRVLTSIPWSIAVFDEAQKVKNPRTKSAKAARALKARFRLALTGTPVENRLLELWSVVDLVLPEYLGSERAFREAHKRPSQAQLEVLRRRVALITLRRVKEQVLDDLPGKFEDVRLCSMTRRQAELYRSIADEELPSIQRSLGDDAEDIPYMHIFALLTRLKQVCDHPAILTGGEPDPEGSGKLGVLDELLDEALDGDQQVVVFSQYVTMIELLKRHLDLRKIPTLQLTGRTTDRERVIRRFNAGQHERVLLASLLAGGVGIDLTGASVVIHYDRWWNPAKENQATDRVHRIGQRRYVQVYKLVTENTVEERIDAKIRDKLELADQVITPSESFLKTLNRGELAELLGVGRDR